MDERRHIEDELQVPQQRVDDRRDDPDAVDDPADRDFQATADTRSAHGQTWEGQTRDDRIQDDRLRDAPARNDLAQNDLTRDDVTRDDVARDDLSQDDQTPDPRYRDPYDRTGDVLVAGTTDAGTQPMAGPEAGSTTGSAADATIEPATPSTTEPAGTATPAGEQPEGQRAPVRSGHLLDQDPEQVRTRWRELQASFVDDPRESVERADLLVEELVSTLTARTTEMRDRWKNAGEGETEQLRLALREYREMLERLLTLGSGER